MNFSKDWLIILIIALVIFGPSRLAGLGSALGRTIRDFRKSVEDLDSDKPVSQPRSDATRN